MAGRPGKRMLAMEEEEETEEAKGAKAGARGAARGEEAVATAAVAKTRGYARARVVPIFVYDPLPSSPWL